MVYYDQVLTPTILIDHYLVNFQAYILDLSLIIYTEIVKSSELSPTF